MDFGSAVRDFPAKLRGVKPAGAPHTAWQLLEHMRLAQWDILEFSRDAKHVSPKWPKGYWPGPEDLGDEKLWRKSVKTFRDDLTQMEALITDPSTDLFAKIPHGDGQTILLRQQIARPRRQHLGATGCILGRGPIRIGQSAHRLGCCAVPDRAPKITIRHGCELPSCY